MADTISVTEGSSAQIAGNNVNHILLINFDLRENESGLQTATAIAESFMATLPGNTNATLTNSKKRASVSGAESPPAQPAAAQVQPQHILSAPPVPQNPPSDPGHLPPPHALSSAENNSHLSPSRRAMAQHSVPDALSNNRARATFLPPPPPPPKSFHSRPLRSPPPPLPYTSQPPPPLHSIMSDYVPRERSPSAVHSYAPPQFTASHALPRFTASHPRTSGRHNAPPPPIESRPPPYGNVFTPQPMPYYNQMQHPTPAQPPAFLICPPQPQPARPLSQQMAHSMLWG